MPDPVVLSAVRTPITRAYRGALTGLDVFELGEVAVVEAVKRAGVDAEELDDLALGEIMQGGGNVARYVATKLGLDHVPGLAVQRHCASGMSAVTAVAADIVAGMTTAAVAGGSESMTSTPQVFRKSPRPFGGVEPWVSPSHPDTPEAPNMNMGVTVGENTAAEAGVSREEQDRWAYHSHRKAVAAIDAGRFDEEIVPVEVPASRGTEAHIVDTDEGPRRDTSLEALGGLPPVFKEDGTVTAGNSSPINDGSAALVLAADDFAAERGLAPLARIVGWAAVGVEPRLTGLAPTKAVPQALDRAGVDLDDVDLFEIHEAFASMAAASTHRLGIDPDIVNVNGGGVALGHPVACTGARILVTLVHELRRRGGGTGVATLCAGGGMGAATVVEVPAG